MMNQRLRFTLRTVLLLSVAALGVARAEDYAITTFAGAANVITGADGTPGSFNNPYGVAIDSAKNIYVADTLNNTIRKITPARVVSTIAGSAGLLGSTDGTGNAARFNFPVGLAVDGSGNIYVADGKNFTIRKITAAGAVTTIAGAPFQLGSADGPGASARFFLPFGIAVDGSGNLYVADSGNQLIRKIAADGTVSTLAGSPGQSGFVNGTGAAARFSTPFGVALDGAGNVYVADSGNHAIRKITPAGAVTTVAGTGDGGAVDGAAVTSRFNQPRGVSLNAAGMLFVADFGNSTIRQITPTGTVSTLAGASGIVGEVNSVGIAARFYDPVGIVADGTTLFVADSTNNLIRRGQPASSAPLPVISLQPMDQEVVTGQSVTFGVSVTGSSLSYQWLLNREPIPGATNATYTISSPQPADSASYSVRVTGAGGSVDSAAANLTVTPIGSGPIQITARPLSQNANEGQPVTFSITVNGSGLTYQWFKNGGIIAGATTPAYNIGSARPTDAATYTVRVTAAGVSETAAAKLTVGGVAGTGVTITTQPTGRTVDEGASVSFTVVAAGSGTLFYQWLKDEVEIPNATGPTYTISTTRPVDTGSYSVRVSANGQNVISSAATLTVNPIIVIPVGPTSRLSNLSVRTAMAAGQTLIVGVTVDGGARNVLVRAAGPALATFGLSTAMVDPRMDLYTGTTLTFSNDDWPSILADTFTNVGAFAFPIGSKDAGFLQNIEGGRSIQVRGTGAGVVLVEAYDLGAGNTPRLVNVSARNRVGTGDDILIAGFNIAGTGTKRLLIRAVGPKLGVFGVTGFLADPKLEIYSGSTKLTENDNWAATLAPTFDSVAAFALDVGSRDAALVTTLDPGTYTVQVSGVGGGTGEALIEIYELPSL